jgi:hypothetical protein
VKRKYQVNNDFFKVWSHDMAYILGFWWADGWIYKDEFCISQEKSRQYILEKILNQMESNYPIEKRKWGTNYFKIQSREMCKDIVGLGGKENKSRDIGFPTVPQKYLSDFIRGYFDGDGCICKIIDSRRTKRSGIKKYNYMANFTSGSKIFIYELLQCLRLNISGFRGYIQTKNPVTKVVNGTVWESKECYVLMCGQNDARRLKKFIYNGSNLFGLKLLEKFDKFKDIGEISSDYLTKTFLSMNECRKIALDFKINSSKEWKEYAKKCNNIPLNPQKVYLKEWSGWREFLGKTEHVDAKNIQ